MKKLFYIVVFMWSGYSMAMEQAELSLNVQLHMAVDVALTSGDTTEVERLMDTGADPYWADETGYSIAQKLRQTDGFYYDNRLDRSTTVVALKKLLCVH